MPKIIEPEQRIKQRKLTSFSVGICGKDGKVLDCKALNLSIAGMLLDYDGEGLEVGSSMSIVVSLKNWKSEIPSIVVHCNSNCIGVKFHKPQSDLYRVVTRSVRCTDLSINSRIPISYVA